MAVKPRIDKNNRNSILSKTDDNASEENLSTNDSQKKKKTNSRASEKEASDRQFSSSPGKKPETVDLKIDDSNMDLNELEEKLSSVANDFYKNSKIPEDNKQSLHSDAKRFESEASASIEEAIDKVLPVLDDTQEIAAELTEAATPVQAANDYPENPLLNSSLIYALQKKPSHLTSRVCAALGLAWFAGCLYYGYINLNSDISGIISIADFFASPRLMLLTIAAILPMILLWAFASMMRSAQEMRNITHTMTKSAIHLLQPESSAINSVSTLSQVIRSEMAAIDNGVERTISRASELEHMVQNEITNLERSYTDSEVRLCGLINELSSERENIEEHAEKLHKSIANAHSGLTEELNTASSHIQDTISQANNQITRSINEHSSSFSISVLEMEKNLEEKITAVESGAQKRLSASGEEFSRNVATKTSEFVDHIKSAGDAMSNMLDMRSEQISTQNNETTRKFEDTIILRSTEFIKRVEETGDTLNSTLESRISTIGGVLSSQGITLVEDLGIRAEELDKILGDRAVNIKKSINDGMNEAITVFDEKRKSLDGSLNKYSGELLDAVSSSIQNLDKVMAQRTDSVNKTITDISVTIAGQATEFEQSLSSHVDGIVLRLSDKTGELQSAAGEIEANISQCTQNMNNHALTHARELSENFNQNQNQIMQVIQSGHDLAAEKLDRKLSETVTGLDNKAEQLSKLLGGRVDQINKSMGDNLVENQRSLEAKTIAFKNLLDDRSVGISSILKEHSQKLSQQTSTIGAELSERYAEFSTIVNEKTIPALDSIHQSGEQITQSLTETQYLFKENSIKISGMLEEHSQKLSQQTGAIGGELSERSIEFSNIIADRTIPVLESIRQSSNEITQSLDKTSIELDARASDIIDKLSSSSQDFHTLLNQAEKKMNITQSSLIQHFSSLTETFNKASTGLEVSGEYAKDLKKEMNKTTTDLLVGMDSTATQLNEQSNLLIRAAKQIDTSQIKFSTTLDERHKILDKLSNGLLHRSDEIETSMSALAITVNKMLEEINSKSKEFGRTIGMEVSTAINDSATRFKDTTESIKAAAKDVSTELEKTRIQMRRGILELPEETRQNADSMRRVVTDQIRALKNLSDIVTNSEQILGTETAAKRLHTNNAPSTPGQNATQSVADHSLGSSSKVPEEKQPVYTPPETTFQQKSAVQTPAQSLQKTKNSSSWVSDLLKRASENEPSFTPPSSALPQKPKQPVGILSESFNALSMKIAQTIDHKQSATLWDRYQHGERDIFTRHLHTIQGQKIFDEIRRKYQNDQNFRNVVNQYIEGFERLLSDNAQKDSDNNIQNQAYLTSDIGKVYVMLAHALQRFKS